MPEPTDYGSLQAAVSLDKERGLALLAGRLLLALLELAVPVNESDAQHHPAFSYRPETGEEIYHSFLGVPVLRGGNTLGVLVVQNKARRSYSEEEIEAIVNVRHPDRSGRPHRPRRETTT